MKILFIMRNQAYMRNYESTLIALAKKGHQVDINFNVNKDNDCLVERIAQDYPLITYSYILLPERRDIWKTLIQLVRTIKDYLRYLAPEYAQAKKLRERVEFRLGFILSIALKFLYHIPSEFGKNIINKTINVCELIIPEDQQIRNFLFKENPDLILITPLVDFDSVQTDYLKSAKSLGIKCGLCVHSWDNLTNKAVIHLEPDQVFVWNKIQQQEAIKFHDIAPEKIKITGAQCYDKWFARKPTTSALEFLRKVKLDSKNNYLLYLCSSPFIAPQEVTFVQELLEMLRNSQYPKIRELGLLIRPHPQNAQQWNNVDLSQWKNSVIWPRGGQNPVTEASKANFYDSIYHSIAVIGVNTSAMIESGILGKSVYSILDPRFKDTQAGTLHFHHLVRGGLLQISSSAEEFIEQLKFMLEGNLYQEKEQIKQFIYQFVRPYGLDIDCTPILVESIELMQDIKPPYIKPLPIWGIGLRIILLPIAIVLRILEYVYKNAKRIVNKLILKKFFHN